MINFIKWNFILEKKEKWILKGIVKNEFFGIELTLSSYYSFYNKIDLSQEWEFFLIPKIDLNRWTTSYLWFPTLSEKLQFEEMLSKLDKFPSKAIQIIISLPSNVLENLLTGKIKIEWLWPSNIQKLKDYYKNFKPDEFKKNAPTSNREEEIKDTLSTLWGKEGEIMKYLKEINFNSSNEEIISNFFNTKS